MLIKYRSRLGRSANNCNTFWKSQLFDTSLSRELRWSATKTQQVRSPGTAQGLARDTHTHRFGRGAGYRANLTFVFETAEKSVAVIGGATRLR